MTSISRETFLKNRTYGIIGMIVLFFTGISFGFIINGSDRINTSVMTRKQCDDLADRIIIAGRNNQPDLIFAKILLHILSQNKKSIDYLKKINSNQDGHFTFKMKPSISLLDYLRRILKYLRIEYSTLIIAMIYIDRICKEKVFLNEYNIHRIMLISIYMAYTYNEDCIYDNKYLALVSGLSRSEMVLLEEDFLDLIDFKLFVSDEIFEQYKKYFL